MAQNQGDSKKCICVHINGDEEEIKHPITLRGKVCGLLGHMNYRTFASDQERDEAKILALISGDRLHKENEVKAVITDSQSFKVKVQGVAPGMPVILIVSKEQSAEEYERLVEEEGYHDVLIANFAASMFQTSIESLNQPDE